MSEFNAAVGNTAASSVGETNAANNAAEQQEQQPAQPSTAAENENESQEDRIAWLRKRGVVVEMPEDRTSAAANEGENQDSDGVWEDVVAVKIPADERQPYEEIAVRVNRNCSGDQFINVLRPMFAGDAAALDQKKLQETASKQFGSAAMPTISKSTLDKLSAAGSVEVFTLAQPYLESGCVGVNVYLDETGQLKSLPTNRRASELAALCGFMGVPFAGDVVVGRIHYSTTAGVRNVDFHRSEVDSSAAWIKGVTVRNYQKGIETNRVAMEGSSSSAANSSSSCSEKGYTVRETDEEVEVVFRLPKEVDGAVVPADIKAARDVAVYFGRTDLTIAFKKNVLEGLAGRVLLHCELRGTVDRGECTWTSVEGGKALEITLCKAPGPDGSTAVWGGKLEADE